MIVGGYAKMFSPAPLKEVDKSHINGNIESIDTKIKIMCVGIFLKFNFINRIFLVQSIKYLSVKISSQLQVK